MSKKITAIHPAEVFSQAIISEYPDSTITADKFRSIKEVFGEDRWPLWCDITPEMVKAIFIEKYKALENTELCAGAIDHLNSLTASLSWIRNKIVYRFDDELSDMLQEQPFDPDSLPLTALNRFPYHCVYIEDGRGKLKASQGYYAWISWNNEVKQKILHLLFVPRDEADGIRYQPVALVGNTVGDAIRIAMAIYINSILERATGSEKGVIEGKIKFVTAYMDMILTECLSHLLYLCTPDLPVSSILKLPSTDIYPGTPTHTTVISVGEENIQGKLTPQATLVSGEE